MGGGPAGGGAVAEVVLAVGMLLLLSVVGATVYLALDWILQRVARWLR